MIKSTTSIINHIPLFLNYCEKEKKLSHHTLRNYNCYLKRFVSWLKQTRKDNLLPYELTSEDIQNYKLYLSKKYKYKGKNLKKITQNYYLIALRALLSYFIAKDIVSIPPEKIELPSGIKREKVVNFLNLSQIEDFLSAPNTRTKIGLRNRAILETIIHTGLKVAQLTNLNRDQININGSRVNTHKIISLPKEALSWMEKYLNIRKDNSKALFIHYRSRKAVQNRLTARSIERIVKKYERKVGLPFSITPEILRWAYACALLDKQNKPKRIQKVHTHKTFIVKNYRHTINENLSKKQAHKHSSSTWHIIENIISKEIAWLKDNIPLLPEGYKENPLSLSDDYILRKIAILIVSGRVGTIEFQAERNKDLWSNLTNKPNLKKISRHGREWHRKMMDVINEYFKLKNCGVVSEPVLHYGRADLEVHLNLKKPLYIEVGTVSLYKLWHNLSSMKNATFLIIPSEKRAIEFKT